jgi:hypothetical protein
VHTPHRSGTQEYSFVLEAGSRLSLHKPIRRSLAGEVPLDGYAVASAQLELPLLRGRCPGSLLDDPTRRHRRSMSSGKVARQGSPTDCSRLCADKTFRMAQQGVNLGVNINSNRCLYTIPEKKVDKLVREVAEVCGIALTSPLQCSKVRGKLSNYSSCIQRSRPFVVPFSYFIGGPRNNHKWDRLKAITEEMRNAASFLLEHMGTLVRLGSRSGQLGFHSLRLIHAQGVTRYSAEPA